MQVAYAPLFALRYGLYTSHLGLRYFYSNEFYTQLWNRKHVA